jgi:hypothetical protein
MNSSAAVDQTQDIAAPQRYRVEIRKHPHRVRIHDRRLTTPLFDWRGAAALHLVNSGAIPGHLCTEGSHACDKSLIMHLALAATSMNVALPRPHAWVAGILHSHPDRHLSEDDLLCLAMLEAPNVGQRRVLDCIDDLVRWRLISRIAVDTEHVFYDIVTEPHLHVFDPCTGELCDAPQKGVLRVV